MDIEMPVMDGKTALRELRARTGGCRARTIALTAHALAEQREAIMAEGFDGYLSKPFKPQELFLAVETLGRGNVRRAGEGVE
jgi:CheY-like chemotaxis protein